MTDTTPPPDRQQPDPAPSDPADPARASHRGRRKASSVALPLVFALALVLVGFLAMWGWISLSGGSNPPPTPSATLSPSLTPSPTPSSASPSASSSPSDTATPTVSSTSASPSRSASPTPTKEPDRSATVVVFNQTGISGLAAAYAAKLQQAGWTVTAVDNWTGYVPETTVYYRPGDLPAARQLMRDMPTVNRIRPAVTGMPAQGLTLILAGNPGAP